MKKSIIVIILFTIFTILISERLDVSYELQQCLNKGDDNVITFAYFSEHTNHHFDISFTDLSAYLELDGFLPLEQRFLLLCVCRSNFVNQKFFISPYSVPDKDEYHDAIILCLIGHKNFESIGIYDGDELFDTLLMKKNEAVPNSVINPFGVEEYKDNDEPACYDFYGFPTKNVLGQKTCLLAVEISQENSYIYSGPLMGNAMIMDSMQFCYSFVEDSIIPEYVDDYCSVIISPDSAKLQCCCARDPHLCSPKGLTNKNKAEQLYCLFGTFNITINGTYENYQSIAKLKAYVDLSINPSCIALIRIEAEEGSYNVSVVYGTRHRCVNETTYYINHDDTLCSFDSEFPTHILMYKCCIDGHFCNQKFNPKKIQPLNCQYKPNYAAYLSDERRCETFFDIWLNLSVYAKIFLNFNAKIPENQRKHAEIKSSEVEYRYIYYQIIKEDNCTLEKRYNKTNVNQYRPFFHVLCTKLDELSPCDRDHTVPPQKLFECENFDLTLFDEASVHQLATMKPTDGGWICYVEIVHISGQNYIHAGELTNLTHHVDCLEKDVINESFCCSDVFSVAQNETECTVKKLIEYNKNARNNDQSKSGSENGFFSNCLIRELPLDSCPSESGCFETRMLEYSKNSDSLEPAGCIDNTEKYISEDNSLASLSLGCRVPENSNKCSVVSSVDGNQRILCCCNGEECKNDATNLPKEIGKKISSFKNPK